MIYAAMEWQSVSRTESLQLPGLVYRLPITQTESGGARLAQRCKIGASVWLGRGLHSHGLALVCPARCTDAGCLYMYQGLIYVDLNRRGTNREDLLQVSGRHTLIPPN